ncbi:MAG: LPS export ABC transporter periplasmic protein LptC [Defluviicoccus sp.]
MTGSPVTARYLPSPAARPAAVRSSLAIGAVRAAFIALAAAGCGTLVLWPYLAPSGDRLHIAAALPVVDLGRDRDAVLNAVYTGIDRHGRPFSLHSSLLRPVDKERNRVQLESPRLSMSLADGRPVTMQANRGVYDQDLWTLALSGDVLLDVGQDYSMKTESTLLDIRKERAEGNQPVLAAGPFGHLQADGFRLEEGGKTVTFLGRSRLISREAFEAGAS